jgi:hypothetical protein
VEKDSGDAGRVPPLDDGLEMGGESRSRDGSFGEGARCTGELGRDVVRELLWRPVSTGGGLGFLFPLLKDDVDDRGD